MLIDHRFAPPSQAATQPIRAGLTFARMRGVARACMESGFVGTQKTLFEESLTK